MAEYQTVMRNKVRMCKTCGDSCEDCPLSDMEIDCRDPSEDEFGALETTVLAWAAEHPEPQYPTWEEWRYENFSERPLPACYGCFGKCLRGDNPHITCTTCRKRPIPADIAKKIGIKPKGK